MLRLTTKTFAIALLSLAAASISMAQTAMQTMNLVELEDMMFNHSKALRGAADAVKAAGAAVDTARTFPNPEVEVMNGTRTPRPNSPGTGNYAGTLKTLSVTQELDMPWHRFPRVDGAMAGYSAAQATEQSFRSDMRAQLRMRYYDLIRRQAEGRATADDAKAAEAMRKIYHSLLIKMRADHFQVFTQRYSLSKAKKTGILLSTLIGK